VKHGIRFLLGVLVLVFVLGCGDKTSTKDSTTPPKDKDATPGKPPGPPPIPPPPPLPGK
jgi:hypothetical protein